MKIILVCLIFVYSFSAAQDTTRNKREAAGKLLFDGSHFSFSFIPYINQKARVQWISGPFTPGSTWVRSGEAGFNNHYHFNRSYSFIIGLHGGASVRNHTLFVPKDSFEPDEKFDFEADSRSSQTVDFYISAPVLVERRWMVNKHHHWNVLAGINVRFYPDQISEGYSYHLLRDNGLSIQVLNFDLEVGRDFKPWVDYNIGGGYNWMLGNNNLLRLNLLANFSHTSITKGVYQVTVPGQAVSTGNYHSRHSFIGLSASYVFTGTNKRLRKFYEKELNYR